MLAALLTPVAVLAAVLGAWRLGADPGWTTQFFIAQGLFSHWQAWFGVAVAVQMSSRSLNRWLEIQDSGSKNVADRHETRDAITMRTETAGPGTVQIQIAALQSRLEHGAMDNGGFFTEQTGLAAGSRD